MRPGRGSHITYNGGLFRKSKAGVKFALGAVVVMVSIEVPDPPVTELGLNIQAALGGSPEQESATELLKPF